MSLHDFHHRPLVYVAGPYRLPNPAGNVGRAVRLADRLQRTGRVTCVVPHLNILWDTLKEHTPTYWLDYDLALLARCDALFRIPGESPGSDREIEFAQERGIPTFSSETELLYWATQHRANRAGETARRIIEGL